MNVPTKFYSSRQENMIAKYLGWSVVSGSGARSFNPGDVRSDDFLGECKTFTKESDIIYCYNAVWSKIFREATSVMKTPVLFVDNGSQLAKNTWCVLPKLVINNIENVSTFDASTYTYIMHVSKTRATFSHCELKDAFSKQRRLVGDKIIVLPFDLAGTSVVLMSLESLKLLIERADD